MGQNLITAPSAQSDLPDIVQEIARDAPGRAVKFGDALVDRAQPAAAFPRSGRGVPECGRGDLRELMHDPTRIIDRLRPEVIEGIRCWPAKRGTPEP
jgi:toxin ParE1/3/4